MISEFVLSEFVHKKANFGVLTVQVRSNNKRVWFLFLMQEVNLFLFAHLYFTSLCI